MLKFQLTPCFFNTQRKSLTVGITPCFLKLNVKQHITI